MSLARLPGLLLLLTLGSPALAATFTVGTCPGATHGDFATAYNTLGTTSGGPHTIRLCPGTHTTAPLSASWGHQGLLIESVSGTPGNTALNASAGTVMTAASQGFTIRNLTVNGSFQATGFANISLSGAVINGNVTTNGNINAAQTGITGNLTANNAAISLVDSGVDGIVLGRNGVTTSGSDLSGTITATNGPITLSGGTIDAVIGTDGGSQPINLTGVTMTGGSMTTAGGTITIASSTIGSAGSPVQITTNNNIAIADSTLFGDLSAATQYSSINLNPATTVFGDCTPSPIGGGTCQQVAQDCSALIGQATINELRRDIGGVNAFIEVRILDPAIGASEYANWTLSYCSARTRNCHSVGLDDAAIDPSGYPWLILTEAGLIDSRDISLGTPGGGIEVRLDDGQGNAIDYLSVDGHTAGLAADCPFQYETTMSGTNSAGIMRLPDGVGPWMDSGPGNSGGEPTPGGSNDGEPPFGGPDHIRLIHTGQGLTCSPETIQVQACANADCSELFDGEVNVQMTSPSGNWLPSTATVDGSANLSLQVTSPGTVILDALATEPAAGNPTRCLVGATESCQMEWRDSGLVLSAPDHVAATAQTLTVAAVRTDDTSQQCVPGFADQTRTVGFWSDYVNPTGGSLPIALAGSAIAQAAPGTPLTLSFDGNGVAALGLVYPDAGRIGLNARFEGTGQEAGLVMVGRTELIARPADLVLTIDDNPAATGAGGPVFRRAGEDFAIGVTARNAAGQPTPNFGREAPAAETVALETGEFLALDELPPVAGAFGAFGLDCSGNPAGGSACGPFNWPEVGVMELTPRLVSGDYLGMGPDGDVPGVGSGPIGRFIPDHFELFDGTIVDRARLDECGADFTWIGERFDAGFTLYARNADGNTTRNYQGEFAWRDGSALNLSGDPTLEVIGTNTDWMRGSGDAVARLRLPRNGPVDPLEDYAVAADPSDADGVTLVSPTTEVATTDLYFGRLVIDNAIGSEQGPLALPWRAEYWDGSTWRVRIDDDCTVLDLESNVILTSSGGDEDVAGTENVSLGGSRTAIDDSESVLTLSGGMGRIHFTTPGAPGWVEVLLELDSNWSFLQDDLTADHAFDNNPEARATWGLFDGDSNRILLREVTPR